MTIAVRRRLLALILVAGALAATLAGAVAGSTAATRDYSPADDPWLMGALEDARIDAALRREARARPEARERRQRSKTAYAGLRHDEAVDLARGVFRRFVEHPLWRPPEPASDERFQRYLDDHTMLLDVEGREAHRLLVSVLPLRVLDADGERRPVSIEFEDRGHFVAPANALTKVRLHKRLGDGLTLPSTGVSVRPGDVEDDGAAASVVGQRLFWSNIATDTDFMAALLPDGFQTFHQLRSAASPERLPLRLDLPDGAELRHSGPAGAEVVAHGERLVAIRPPQAFDADGEDIPVRYELDGNVLVLRIDHRERDIAYPLMVDPAITDEQRYWETDASLSFAGWEMNESHPGSIANMAGTGYWGRGLYTWLEANKWYPHLLSGTWQYRAPGDSFVSRVEFGEMDIYAAGGHGCVVQGFWADYGWNPGWQDSPNYSSTNGSSPWMSCGTSATSMYRVHRVDWNTVTRHNTAAVQLFVNGDGSRNAIDLMFLGGAHTTIEDDRAPAWVRHNMPTGWTRTTSGTFRMEAHDNGLGIYDMLLEGREPGHPWGWAGDWTAPCSAGGGDAGTADFRCGGTFGADHAEQLIEGITEWKLSAWDVVGNGNLSQWTTQVDTAAPWVLVQGALRDLEGKTVAQDTHVRADGFDEEVTLQRPDGSTYVADRSGVRSLELFVDGQRHDYEEQGCDRNCSMSRELTLRVGAVATGEHTIKVVVRDGAGNSASSEEWKLTVGAGTVTNPSQGMRVVRRLPLQATVGTGVTGVAWQYRRRNSEAWTAVPAGALRDEQNNTVTLTNGNLPIIGDKSQFVTWDVISTLGAVDTPLEVRAVFTGGIGGSSAPINAFIDQKGLGSRTARDQIGPGNVDLLTGNFKMTAADVSVEAFRSDLTVARAYNSRDAMTTGVLGPGWTLSTPVDANGMEFSRLVEIPDTPVVQAVLTDGTRVSFTKRSWGYESESGHEDVTLSQSTATIPATYYIADSEGNQTTFKKSGTDWMPSRVEVAHSGPGTRTEMIWSNGKLQTINAPNANSSDDCGGQKARACRTLNFVYASSTNATATAPGDYAGHLVRVDFTSYDPTLQQVTTEAVARYQYDTAGRLAATWDARIAPALKTTYQYDSDNLLTRVTPPGEEPWTLQYQSLSGETIGNGRLKSVSRSALSAGVAVWTLAYGVPLSGTGAPHQMSAAAVDAWAQKDIPTDATALFPPDQVPPSTATDFSRATISYLNRKGEEVNVASPGGHIATTEHDEYGNVIRELTAANRARAGGSRQRALELDTQRRFELKGLRLTDEIGPLHRVQLSTGDVVAARTHTQIRYDEGAPSQSFHLPTTTIVSAQIPGRTDEPDQRISKTKYDWRWRKPIEVTRDARDGGLKLIERTILESEHGFEVERRTPRRPEGGDASATKTVYYTGVTNPDHRECGDRPEWHMLPCKVLPVAQPGTAGLPDLPVTVYKYNKWLDPTETRETTGSHSRTVTTAYDAAGRETSVSMTATTGTAVPTSTIGYSSTTGRATAATAVDAGVTRRLTTAYDSLGRVTSYTDTDGNTSRITYDLLSRTATSDDGKGTQTFSYDPVSGLLTKVTDSAIGVFTASHDPDGQLTSFTLPGGLQVTNEFDETGDHVRRVYEKTGGCTQNCKWLDESVQTSVHGQWLTRTSNLSAQRYTYDGSGRLTKVNDTPSGGSCTTRTYTYDRNGNRTRLVARGAGPTGACDAATAATTTDHAYDAADRIIDTGYQYDAFGRILSVPARDANGGTLTTTYYANDLVRSQTQDGRTNTYSLDPAGRERVKAVTGTSTRTEISHYADDSDAPAWTEDAGTSRWRRYITGIDGDLAAIADSTSGVTLQLTNMHGDVVGEATLDASGSAVLAGTSEADEFGVPKSPTSKTYAWLGAKERSTELPSGVIQMGVRSYVPALGRFLQVDPVVGGSLNDYDYAYQDPVNVTDLDGRCPVCGAARALVNAIKGGAKKAPKPKPPRAAIKKAAGTFDGALRNKVFRVPGRGTPITGMKGHAIARMLGSRDGYVLRPGVAHQIVRSALKTGNWTTKPFADGSGRVVWIYKSRLGQVRMDSKGTVLTVIGRSRARLNQIPRWKK